MKLLRVLQAISFISVLVCMCLSLKGQARRDSVVYANRIVAYETTSFYDKVIVDTLSSDGCSPGIMKQYIYKNLSHKPVYAPMFVVYVGYPMTVQTDRPGETLLSDERVGNRRILHFKNIETGLFSRQDYIDSGAVFLYYHMAREEDVPFFENLLDSVVVYTDSYISKLKKRG